MLLPNGTSYEVSLQSSNFPINCLSLHHNTLSSSCLLVYQLFQSFIYLKGLITNEIEIDSLLAFLVPQLHKSISFIYYNHYYFILFYENHYYFMVI